MRISFICAVLATLAVAKPVKIPRNKVNRLSREDRDGDFRMASCELHHSNDLDTKLKTIKEKNLSGTIYVEQIFDADANGWQIPQAYAFVNRLEKGPEDSKVSEYSLSTSYFEDINELTCEIV